MPMLQFKFAIKLAKSPEDYDSKLTLNQPQMTQLCGQTDTNNTLFVMSCIVPVYNFGM